MGRPQLVEVGAAVNATFIGLAFLTALNPKLLAVDLLLIQNTRPRLMLLGGMGIGLAIGLLDVFVLQHDVIKTQGQASAGLDLALGVALVCHRRTGRDRSLARPAPGSCPGRGRAAAEAGRLGAAALG
jgi:hypothetical protein